MLTQSLSEAQKKAEPVVREVMKIGEGSLGVGFLSSKEEQTFVVMVALWIIREAWAFFKEKANKTGEKISGMETKMNVMSEKFDAFIRTYEKEERRFDDRMKRVERRLDDI